MAETGGRPVLAVDPSTLSLSHKAISATNLGISHTESGGNDLYDYGGPLIFDLYYVCRRGVRPMRQPPGVGKSGWWLLKERIFNRHHSIDWTA